MSINLQGALIPAAWEEILPRDYKGREYLIAGVLEGFRITTRPYEGESVWEKNYDSAVGPGNRQRVQEQIQEELDNGRYIRCDTLPTIISALGAIPKPGTNKIRIIHDCSRPMGHALNDFADSPETHYQTVQEAAELIGPGFYLAKIDLKSAYRSVRIHPDDHHLTGLAWRFGEGESLTVMRDTRLPYGCRLAPSVFNDLTQAVRHVMVVNGHPGVVAYLDDFLVIGETEGQCQQTMYDLMCLLRRLGFSINYNKVVGPSRRITFLGIEIDTDSYTLGLPMTKVDTLMTDLTEFMGRRSATKKQLQSLAGSLSWASQVINGGRPHMRRLLDLITPLRAPCHRSRLTRVAKRDLEWWIRFLSTFNGTMPILDHRPLIPVCLDACPVAGGGYFAGDWFHVPWAEWPGADGLHINYKEVLTLEPAARLWAHWWANHRVTIHSDNQAAVGIINRGTAKDPFIMAALRRVFWLSAIYNFRLRAVYYPGARNTLADAASRLHEPGALQRLMTALDHTALY